MATAVPDRIHLGPLGYGAAAVGNLYRAVDDETAGLLLDAAWDSGIRYYDTAPHYGLGLSERRLGEMLRRRPREEFVVSTKVGRLLVPDPDAGRRDDDLFEVPADHRRVWDFSESGVRRSLEDSLGRLGLDRVDVLYLHDVERSGRDIGEVIDAGVAALARLRDEGLVRAIGIGSSDLDAVERAVRTEAIDLVMLPGRYTLLETPAKDVVLPLCLERGVGIVNVGVFNSGLLATPDPSESSHYEYREVPPDKLRRAQELAQACRELGVELPTAAMHFSSRHPAVVSVVVGADTPEQIRQNAARLRAGVPEELWETLGARGMLP
jgi:D-threo-aldose 1-dehydrogenase